jgi:hypothetical protein
VQLWLSSSVIAAVPFDILLADAKPFTPKKALGGAKESGHVKASPQAAHQNECANQLSLKLFL